MRVYFGSIVAGIFDGGGDEGRKMKQKQKKSETNAYIWDRVAFVVALNHSGMRKKHFPDMCYCDKTKLCKREPHIAHTHTHIRSPKTIEGKHCYHHMNLLCRLFIPACNSAIAKHLFATLVGIGKLFAEFHFWSNE